MLTTNIIYMISKYQILFLLIVVFCNMCLSQQSEKSKSQTPKYKKSDFIGPDGSQTPEQIKKLGEALKEAVEINKKRRPDYAETKRKEDAFLKALNSLTPAEIKFITQDNPNSKLPTISSSYAYGPQPVCTIEEVRKIRDELGPKRFEAISDKIHFGSFYEYSEFAPKYQKRFQELLTAKNPPDKADILELLNMYRYENLKEAKRIVESHFLKQLAKEFNITEDAVRKMQVDFAVRYPGCLSLGSADYLIFRKMVISEMRQASRRK